MSYSATLRMCKWYGEREVHVQLNANMYLYMMVALPQYGVSIILRMYVLRITDGTMHLRACLTVCLSVPSIL